ncbi:MAG: hypothetical protein MUQ30_13790, partial [Anaerolineae bacterium]|nr:hypothetical protein [Anaerolineae bacterium]
ENRIDDPAYGETVAEFREHLLQWALFDARTRVHLDTNAPVITGANVLQRGDGHAEEMEAYFARRMGEAFEL